MCRYSASMKRLSAADFLEVLQDAAPSTGSVVDEHLADNDGLLIHLLLPDLLRVAVARFGAGDVEVSDGILRAVEQALTDGDDYLVNGVQVSFVEHVGAWPGETPEFMVTWPPALFDELREQQSRLHR